MTDSAWKNQPEVAKNGLLTLHKTGTEAYIVTYGVLTANALVAAQLLEQKGISVGVIRLLSVEPIPTKELADIVGTCKNLFVVEECCAGCGIQESLACQ